MNRVVISKISLTAVLVVGTVSSFILDWRSNHLLNPAWPPHARFHGDLLLFTLAGMSATGLWLLWRRSLEPFVGIQAAALLALSYWTTLFYVNALVPGSSLWAGQPGAEIKWHGHVVEPNLIVAAVFVLTTLVAWRLGRSARSQN